MKNKEKREELSKRFLTKGEILISEIDYEFLSLFKTYKEAILNNNSIDLYLIDNGNMYRTSWVICTKNNNNYKHISDTLENNTIVDKILELYPYSELEIEEIEKKKCKKKYKTTDKAPGKHKDKTWLEVKKVDEGYINWMISVTKDINLKKMLKEL